MARLSPEERQLLSSVSQPSKGLAWNLVEIPDGRHPEIRSYVDRDQLVDDLRRVVSTGRSRVFIFLGRRIHISTAPFRHLLVPDEEPIPLFDIPSVCLPDDTGYVGRPEDEPVSYKFESPKLEDSDDDGDLAESGEWQEPAWSAGANDEEDD